MAAYWEIAAHSAYDVFDKYKYLIVNLIFPTSVLGVAGSIPGFSSPSDGTINRCPVSI